jgi:hypothetical protein
VGMYAELLEAVTGEPAQGTVVPVKGGTEAT